MDWRYHILKKTGYSFYSKETSGMTVEFIGTSGVGKTTLFRETLARLRYRWFFSYHLEFLRRKAPPSDIDQFLMEMLKVRIDKIMNSDSYCPWHSFLDLKLSVRVINETMLVSHCSNDQGYAFDEGLFRHFPAEILDFGDAFPEQLWHNRAFIYLRAKAPETALSRVTSRTMTLANQERQRSKTDKQRLADIVHDQDMFQAIVDRAKSFSCPLLLIDAESPMADSVKAVLEFEAKLTTAFKRQRKLLLNSQTRDEPQ